MNNTKLELKASLRQETGRLCENLREKNILPCVVYGHGFPNKNISVSPSDFEKIFNLSGESSLIDLTIDGDKPIKVLAHETQKDQITGKFTHIDFYKVNMDEKIKTEIEIEFIGESPAVKNFGGVLVKTLENLHIECLPGDLINKFEVDLSALQNIDDVLRVSDLKLPENITVLTAPETPVVLVEEMKLEIIKEETPVAEGEAGAIPPTEAEIATKEKEATEEKTEEKK
jgi:large subunit ribosomal protein L25